MSTNEELIREAVNRLKGWASSKSIAEHHASAIRTVLDALEQTTRELEEARLELDATETKATGYRQNNTRMADTLAKVRVEVERLEALEFLGVSSELRRILDESI